MVDVSLNALIVAVTGSSGSGKSAWVKQQIAKKKRAVIWDPDNEYGDFTSHVVSRIQDLTAAMRQAGAKGNLKIRFVHPRIPPSDKDARKRIEGYFNLWAAATFTFGHCVAVAEEISDVTSPGKAPPGWGQLVRRGRKHGIEIYGLTQRPSESDKTILGNASDLHCGMMNRAKDRKYMAEELDIPQVDIDNLQELEYWHRCHRKKTIVKGKLKFKK